jgi:hypothetical protein
MVEDDAEYPWGNPLHLSPAMSFSHCAELVMLLPNPNQQSGGGGGLNVAISLQPRQFPRFHCYFLIVVFVTSTKGILVPSMIQL